ncbi:isoleucyl-tRNA synthetase [Bipolaris maydis]|nr:isoleucyl-tRNA synthetase [Bipolaris maydis]
MEDGNMQLQPGRSIGFMTLGCSLHEVLTTIKAEVKTFPRFQLYHDDFHPISSPVQVVLPDNGLRLQFDGPDQRLRLIEVLDFAKARLVYKDIDVYKPADGGFSAGPPGPRFRHVYDKLLGPTYGGEYVPPKSEDPNAMGTYNLSYPGIAFNFPVQHSAYSPKKDFISLLSSSATGPATSMAVFNGESWQKARATLFTAPPSNPRSLMLGKTKDSGPDEIETVKVHGEGRIELVRRSSPPFWIVLSETTPQDLIMELGAPDSIYRKNDHRLSIHKDRRTSDASDLSPGGLTPDEDSDPGSAIRSDDEGAWEDDDDAVLEAQEREIAAAEHFYNYYHHGFDILISQPTQISPPSPTAERRESDVQDAGELSAQPLNHLTATKIIFHGNIPGSYQFNRHRRSRWTLEHVPSAMYREPLNSEMGFGDISGRLKEVFKPHYENEEQERLQQRGMALNRGWGDSPGSSCELLGGWEDSSGRKSKFANAGSVLMEGVTDVGNVELFGFPGMVFEVLKNGAVSSLTDGQTAASEKEKEGPAITSFTLHDGPPYANGPLHIGHALNKITKDVICRFEVGQGKKVSYIPGWDCHGLPIEIKALQAQKKDAAQTDAVSVREAARELAAKTIEEQKSGFREWAVMGEGFELRQLEVFKVMFEKGLVYRQFKPAELEYDEGFKSLAAFVRYPVKLSEALKAGVLKNVEDEVSVAIAVHRDMQYCIVKDAGNNNELILIATSRIPEYEKILEHKLEIVISELRGSDLANQVQYENPFQKASGLQPIIHADFVTDSSGTGLVHLAPGHGMDDYNVCTPLGIPAFAPVDDAGAFTKDAFPEQPDLLEGLPVTDIKKSGSNAVCNYLQKLGLLRAKQNYRHKYPIDWRTKEPVITRATEQWFANVEGIKDASMKAIANVAFKPESGRSRLESFIQGRSQWCISRQRAWEGDRLEAAMDSKVIEHVIQVIKERGINAWWTDAPDDAAWKPSHLNGTYVRGRDTMDVWFDNEPVADVYLEGTDQHRGWFQSSLLTHVATQPYSTATVKAPYKTLITHGFTLDSDGRKMSKSLGNVISPFQIMSGELLPPVKRKKQKGVKQDAGARQAPTYDSMGADALRLWAASSDYTRDVTIGQPLLMSVNQALHKYRVTFKWLLGIFSLPSLVPCTSDFGELTDRLAVHRLVQGLNTLNKYIAMDLSAFYFETLKDRTLQRVLGLIFYELLQMLAPVCPLLVEESIHPARATWERLAALPESEAKSLERISGVVATLGAAIKIAQERVRAEKKIGSSLDINMLGEAFAAAMHPLNLKAEDMENQLAALFVISEVRIRLLPDTLAGASSSGQLGFVAEDAEQMKRQWAWVEEEAMAPSGDQGNDLLAKARVLVHPPSREKCPRCWRFVKEEAEDVCGRCAHVVEKQGGV